jgi:hypothetical protein
MVNDPSAHLTDLSLSPDVWFFAALSSCLHGVVLTVEYVARFSAFTSTI